MLAILLTLISNSIANNESPLDFDSATAIALDTSLSAEMLSEANNALEYREEISEQLNFLVGSLNAKGAVADLGHARVEILKVDPVGDRFRVHYQANFLISWNRSLSIPTGIRVVLPNGGDETGLGGFFRAFSSTCSQNPNEPSLDRYSFYYYFRPNRQGCVLQNQTPSPALEFLADVTLSLQNTSNKRPEYRKIWEDGKLVATLIFVKLSE